MCENSRTIYTIATIITLLLHYKYHTNTTTNKHFLLLCNVSLVSNKKKNKYIYINLIIKTIIITIIILLGIFSCPCVVCVSGWRVCPGAGGLLKLSQVGRCWQAGKCWERYRRRSGVGGSSGKRITAGDLMATFDNLYRKCYNKRSDNNKNVICHQTGKNAPTKRFPS